MSPETWKKVKSIFNAASELPKDSRQPFLVLFDNETRLEVEKMLNANDEDWLNEPIVDFNDFEEISIPEKIGDYKIIGELGHGGMGTVYEAFRETENFKQRVALKVIKRGMNNELILKRFRSEQQILATLEHPNIGRFLDGGKTAEGLPFYAMEFIEGIPIDEFCLKNNLSVTAIINLFREVCTAVSYAHTNLIVHRDLKPSNIIVTKDGTPKLLDFGIAKVLDIDSKEVGTATQLGMMTPQYASPEQIRGEKVTTVSDVYSLGVIFYEILTGKKPYKTEGKSYAEILEIVTQTNPFKPSEHRQSQIHYSKLKGDLDIIALKSLQKLPERRYQSVEQFSEDLQRHLVGLPISARPDTFHYRFSKFVERNRIGVAAACLVFLSLLTGIGVASWQAYRAEKQRHLAEKRFAEVRTIANNVVFKYHNEIEKLSGSTAVREMLVKDATTYLDNLSKDLENDTDLEYELALAYLKLGDVQGKIYAANIGNTAGARESYQKAVNLLELVIAKKTDDASAQENLIKAYDSIVFLMARTGESEDIKLDLLNKSAKLIEKMYKSEPVNSKRLFQEANLYIRFGDSVGELKNKSSLLQKLEYHQKALNLADEIYRIEPENTENLRILARINQRIGTDYIWLGENAVLNNFSEEAPPFFAQALPYHEKMADLMQNLNLLMPDDPSLKRFTVAGYITFAGTLHRNKKKNEALKLAQKALQAALLIQENDPHNQEAKLDIAETYGLFSQIYTQSAEIDKAVENLKKNIEIYTEMFKSDRQNREALRKINEHTQLLINLFDKQNNQEESKFYRNKLVELNKSPKKSYEKE